MERVGPLFSEVHMNQYPPPYQHPSYGHSPPPQRSGATGVFWGLVLFFIVLPIAIFGVTCVACGASCAGCAALGAGASHHSTPGPTPTPTDDATSAASPRTSPKPMQPHASSSAKTH